MSPEKAAEALKKMADIIGDENIAIGIWEGEVTGTMSGNAFKGNHVSAFNDSTMIAPFGPQGDSRSEASAMLFALAKNNATALARALQKDFTVDVTLVSPEHQLKSIEDTLVGCGEDDSLIARLTLNQMSFELKVNLAQGKDLNELLPEIEASIDLLKKFRTDVILNVNQSPKINMTTILIARANELDLKASDLDDLIHDIYANSATIPANETADEHGQEHLFKDAELTASAINNEGLYSQIECLVKAYGIAGATNLINKTAKDLKSEKPKVKI